jgi:hypothetical protein
MFVASERFRFVASHGPNGLRLVASTRSHTQVIRQFGKAVGLWLASTGLLAAFLAVCPAKTTAADAAQRVVRLESARLSVAHPRVGTYVGCFDTSGSLPIAFVTAARDDFSRVIETSVSGTEGGIWIYLRALDASSYDPTDGVLTAHIPAVPPRPTPVARVQNPFDTAKNNADSSRFSQEVARWHQSIGKAQAAARIAGYEVAASHLPSNQTGTDLVGCELRASDLFSARGDNRLYIASDLQPWGPQSDSALLHLGKVKVTVAMYCDASADECAQREQSFADINYEAGAKSVQFLDPQNV